MVYKVISTKLSEEEHDAFINACNQKGCTPSAFIKEATLEKINSTKKNRNLTDTEIRKFLGIKRS